MLNADKAVKIQCLCRSYYVLCTILSTIGLLIHLILITPRGGPYYYLHFIDMEIEAQRLSNITKAIQLGDG